MVRDDYHDIERLLLLKNINSSKNCIPIIVKENITVQRQNGLIAHSYHACCGKT